MEPTIKVNVQPLTSDAFRPYGQVLESRHPQMKAPLRETAGGNDAHDSSCCA